MVFVFFLNYNLLIENLQIWFINIGKQIEKISMDDELVTSRKITQIIKALDEVQGIALLLYIMNFNCFYVHMYLYFVIRISSTCEQLSSEPNY